MWADWVGGLSIYLSVRLSVCLSIYLSTVSVCLSACFFVFVSRGPAEKLLYVSSEIFIVRAGSLMSHSDTSTLSTRIFHFLCSSSVLPHTVQHHTVRTVQS